LVSHQAVPLTFYNKIALMRDIKLTGKQPAAIELTRRDHSRRQR